MPTTRDWTVYAVETVSGTVVAEIPFINTLQYSRKLNEPGGGSVYVPVGGTGMSQRDIAQLAMPWRWSLAICYKGTIIQAGPVAGEGYTGSSGGYTQLSFAGMWKVFQRRVVLPTTSTWTSGNVTASDANTSLSGLTYGGIAQTLVQTQINRGTLPITFTGNPATGTRSITYNGYDLNICADMLINLTNVIGGCEIDFAPYWATPGQVIKWQMRVSDTRLGQQGAPWVFDFPRGALQDADYGSDGSQMTFSEFARGSGSQGSLVVGSYTSTTLTSNGYPLLESVNGDHTSVTDPALLTSYAQAGVTTYQWPNVSPAVYVRVDGKATSGTQTGSPTLEQISVGDTGTFQFQNHRRIPDGTYTWRIVEMTQGLDVGSTKLVMQPGPGVA